MSVTEADFNRSAQVLLRHGFVVLSCSSKQPPTPTETRLHCPSPVGPAQYQYETNNDEDDDDMIGMRRVVSETNLRRSVTWDLSYQGRTIPPLPYTKEEHRTKPKQQIKQERKEASRRLRRQDDESQQLRSSIKTVETSKGYIPMTIAPHQNSSSRAAHPPKDIIPPNQQQQYEVLRKTTVNSDDTQPQSQLSAAEMFERMMISNNDVERRRRYTGFRNDYYLGDTVKSATHMVIESTTERAIQAVDILQTHHFAWVKRSNGLFTYAILAYRSYSTLRKKGGSTLNDDNDDGENDEYMYFVLNDSGSTKMVHKKHWSKCIRLVYGQAE
ncbi:hypothetical protein ACHAWU_005547 [Discostella pseudostelligera]|uniref:Uncharacterized protein n=1 Tax=Discostella pseudostelligera TaxID=259834 RepID=A0ABD3N8E6_9STRA